MKYRAKIYLCLAFFICLMQNCFALSEDEKLWLGLSAQQTLSADHKWHSFIFSQLRFINKSHPWQATLIEGGLGYFISDNNSLWLGYRWSGVNPNNGFFQENRLFQQNIWQIRHFQPTFILRSRLEEIERGNQSQISIRLRERLALELAQTLFSRASPFIYNEIFIPLNATNYTSSKFINENRLFLGFNLYQSQTTWWEIGYINQYQMQTPLMSQNQMSHIASFTYNFA